MRLKRHPNVDSIQETQEVTLTEVDGEPVTVRVRDLPPDFQDKMEAELPTPQPPQTGVVRDDRGQPELDDQTGRPIPEFDYNDPDYRERKREIDQLQSVFIIVEGLKEGEVEFQTAKDPEDPEKYYRQVRQEMKEFGFGMSHINKLAEAIREVSGIDEQEVEEARRGFSESEGRSRKAG